MNSEAPGITLKFVDELERENARLQKLVAELLVRNQQLRHALESATRVGTVERREIPAL
jgi:hypothetical protein